MGFQEKFLSSPADIVIGGGAAGAGKTYALLMDAMRYRDVDGFGAIIFRRTTPQITNIGGLWDTSSNFYPLAGFIPKESTRQWRFGNVSIRFNHLEYEKNVYDHQGAQYAFIAFDELTHFTKKQFFYMMSRNRSMCGIWPCIRATCNPDPDSWVADFISWWIDPDTGFPIPERDGVLRYFTVDGNNIVWGDSKQEVIDRCPHIFSEIPEADRDTMVKSVTFIFGNIYHNKILVEQDPSYLGNLLAQDPTDKARLLQGNWKIKQDDDALCNFERVKDVFTNALNEYEQDEKGNFKLNSGGQKIQKNLAKKITVDAARFGRDLAVVAGWVGMRVKYWRIRTKCDTVTLRADIEEVRALLGCGKSDVLVDQDGIGGGVVDEGGYQGFSGGGSVLLMPGSRIKENYANLKTQCWYHFSEDYVNKGLVAIDLGNVKVDGVETKSVRIGSEIFEIEKLIKQDLRCFKRKDADHEGKKRMNSKEEQKIILNGRSPDFGDTIMMRMFFEFKNFNLRTIFV